MDFKEYVKSNKESIYSVICRYVPIKEPEGHYKIVREYIDRQGSYRRPGLLMLSGEMFGAEKADLLLPSAAMQLSEDWILIHDDIEDHSELRRGKPTLHKMYGEELAINAGDSGHMAMWRMLKDYIAENGIEKGNRLYEKFYNMLEYTVEGQYIDDNFIYNIRTLDKASEELYYRIVKSKTGYYSAYGPMQLGAIVAGQEDRVLETLKKIGEPAGIAFQLVDDILDMTADEKVFGKQTYGDLYEGKVTLIMLHTYAKADDSEKQKINSIYFKKRGDKSEEEIGYIADLVEKYGGIEYARIASDKYGEMAKSELEKAESILPNNKYRDILTSAIEEMYTRKV